MKKINSLQSLRAFAFLVVLVSHCNFPKLQGSLGVSIFFILSGFCLAINYIPKAETLPNSFVGCVRFGIGRIKKLYALHIIMLLFKMFFLWGMPHTALDYFSLLMNVCLLQSLVPYPSVYSSYNGISWFLSTYMLVCMIAPPVMRLAERLKSGRKLISLSAVILVFMAAFGMITPRIAAAISAPSVPYFTYNSPLFRIFDFSLGIFLGKYYLTFKSEGKTLGDGVSVGVGLAAVACGLACTFGYPYLHDGIRNNLIYIPGSVLAITFCAFSSEKIQKLIACKPLVWLGNVSGYAFLIHNNILEIFRYILNLLEFKYGYSRTATETVIWIILTFTFTVLATQLYITAEGKVKARLKSRAEQKA